MRGLAPILERLDSRKIDDLIEEANSRNHVTVTVYRAIRGETGIRHKQTIQEEASVIGQAPSLVLADIGRMLAGKKPLYFAEAVRRCGGELVGAFPNLRTNVGVDYCAAQLSGTSVLVADTIALSATTRSAAATDGESTLPWSTNQSADATPVQNPAATSGEITFGGLTRAAATYAHSVTGPGSATTTYTLSKTFTALTAITSVQMAGLFGGSAKAAIGGTDATNMLFLETKFTPTTLANTDQLALTWTVNI